jgi:ATP-dependent helicase YprA (DUF1998 family)
MTVRTDILAFLNDPGAFARTLAPGDERLWAAGLEEFGKRHLVPPGRTLRAAQEAAWAGMADRRTALLLGPPGTGKTWLLAWMAAGYLWALRRAGRPGRVLATGFTREAIGNLLEALAPITARHLPEITLAFLGNPPGQGLPAVLPIYPLGRDELTDARALLRRDGLVVGATGWSLFKLFDGAGLPGGDGPTAPLFDLVLIDEASQMVLGQGLLALSGLAEGGRVIIAGDDRQLPPIHATYEGQTADGRALGGSLYGFVKSGRVTEFRLDETFRLNDPLTIPPARQFYDGRYTSAVADRRLALRPGWADGLPAWQRAALDPEHPVCILLHDGPPCGTDNPFERSLIAGLVAALVPRLSPAAGHAVLDAATLWSQRLAIITPHRAQNVALRAALEGLPSGDEAVVETVDRIQGRERDVIIAGYTVSDPEFALAEAAFLFSSQRLNVTVTRARSKLILLVSRRLLEVIPPDEAVFDAADQLREYIYSGTFVDRIELAGPGGRPYPVEVRLRPFDESQPLPELREEPAMPARPTMTPELERLLLAIKAAEAEDTYDPAHPCAYPPRIREKLGMVPPHAQFRALVELGKVAAIPRTNRTTGVPFLVWKSRPEEVIPHLPDLASARAWIEDVTATVRSGDGPALYAMVRDRFLWFDEAGRDLFRASAERLVAEGRCRFETRIDAGGRPREAFDLSEAFPDAGDDAAPREPEGPEDEDFTLLNALEDAEEGLINFGVFETRIGPDALAARLGWDGDRVRRSLRRLEEHRYLLRLDDHDVRSRMSELAREVRYVKQRFAKDDAHSRPFLVRSMRLVAVDRSKPARRSPLGPTVDRLSAELADVPGLAEVLALLGPMLTTAFRPEGGGPPALAAFQLRALEQILPAYLGRTGADTFVITADTGSGKTEAALLPLIAGAAIDARAGRRGVKAVLVYPRIRLAYNQAQRLALYLAALAAAAPDAPPLTLGLQTKDVPTSFDQADRSGLEFPFFTCPASRCGGALTLWPGRGRPRGNDLLECLCCGWRFGGFLGSKRNLAERPPDFFLPVTESLHQWLHRPDYFRLFGDAPGFAPPRALMADEIHLYSHIQGAQVGYTFRRLLARAELNARRAAPGAPSSIAIGMSATLGEPPAVWGALSGRRDVGEIRPEPEELEDSGRGREYFYFLQPEVESRGRMVAGASTTIQTLMCLTHGMRRRSGDRGGYRGLVFFDSIDELKALHRDYRDAEEVQNLARLRTRHYPDEPATGRPRTRCCGQPASCDLFRLGECWYFAAAGPGTDPARANDPYQTDARGRYRPGRPLHVLRTPVYSAVNERVDEMIRRCDLVFATSSLEVGYDDPEMILVYQHYAPTNLASFIQRKGRGGRDSDDRPVTGITLSLYSPRDSWFFRHPDRMLAADGFEVPLNMGNFFVRRGQAVAALLDGVARGLGGHSGSLPLADVAHRGAIAARINREVDELIRRALGAEIFEELGVADAAGLWEAAVAAIDRLKPTARSWRELLPWVPDRLFDSINLPLLRVTYPSPDPQQLGTKETTEDIALAFGRCAPGNPTRRYGRDELHWLPPPQPQADAPMLPMEQYALCRGEPLLSPERRQGAGNTRPGLDRAIRRQFPVEVRQRLPEASVRLIDHELCRPGALRLEVLGSYVMTPGRPGRTHWRPVWFWDPSRRLVVPMDDTTAALGSGLVGIHPKSRARLLGFPLVEPRPALAEVDPVRGLGPLADQVRVYVGGRHGPEETGLRVARAYWGVDVQLLLDDRDRTVVSWRRAFTDPKRKYSKLHGYLLHTEGVQLRPDPDHLRRFLDREERAIAEDESRSRWLHGQFFRYLLTTRFLSAGLSDFDAGPITDLLVAANSDDELRARLRAQMDQFDPPGFTALIHAAFERYLICHPLLKPQRLGAIVETIQQPKFRGVFLQSLNDVRDSGQFRRYLHSLVLHGLALGLHGLFVLHGRGDERQVLLHAQLPIQFDDPDSDAVTVCEAGDFGDGTTRTFQKHLDEAFASWRHGELADCPYAAEDALLDLLFTRAAAHAAWRGLDPTHPATLPRIGRELTGTAAMAPEHLQALGRVLFRAEMVGAESFPLYDLHREIRSVRNQLRAAMGRNPNAWELVSASARGADQGDPAIPEVRRLLEAYRRLDAGSHEESLSPLGRLADQVFRLSASLCVDGCLACLQRDSDLMGPSQAAVAVSRDLLARYREMVLEPLTLKVGPDDESPSSSAVSDRVAAHGTCRLLVDPRRYDVLESSLASLGFGTGRFDPMLRQVVVITVADVKPDALASTAAG